MHRWQDVVFLLYTKKGRVIIFHRNIAPTKELNYLVNQLGLFDGRSTPQKEHNAFQLHADLLNQKPLENVNRLKLSPNLFDDSISQSFPTLVCVGFCIVGLHSQDSIEQNYTW